MFRVYGESDEQVQEVVITGDQSQGRVDILRPYSKIILQEEKTLIFSKIVQLCDKLIFLLDEI